MPRRVRRIRVINWLLWHALTLLGPPITAAKQASRGNPAQAEPCIGRPDSPALMPAGCSMACCAVRRSPGRAFHLKLRAGSFGLVKLASDAATRQSAARFRSIAASAAAGPGPAGADAPETQARP
jgi:hypothetical protein